MREPSPELETGAKRLLVLAHPERLHIAAFLLEGPHSVAELAQALGKSAAVVSDHLELMSTAGLVDCEGVGEYATYSFLPEVSLAALGLGDMTIDMGCCKLTLNQIRDLKKASDNS
jgi:DNA-binding transcriptional ArsR family regulator